ncbi:MAG TPA: glycosyltransferase family 39 protein [Bryobacteraceae bacterium]|nr:glycosyltransferase family 39 protein [Bryobacteraceae bacterium]
MTATDRHFGRWEILFAGMVLALGLAIRLWLASVDYLNPDEIDIVLCALGSFSAMLHKSLTITHPPMLETISWVLCKFTRSELALRMAPLLAGSLAPLLLCLWMRRLAGSVAAGVVLVLMTFSPGTIALSVEMRPYTLALFFVAASLLVLDYALESGRWQTMAFYSAVLWLCILADYSTAWFVGAAGVYVLLRWRGLPMRSRSVWAVGQLFALLLYGAIFVIHASLYPDNNAMISDAIYGWLRVGFPQAGEKLVFPLTHTLGQLEFLLAAAPASWIGMAVFAVAIWLLWTGRTHVESGKARALAVLLALPFPLCLAAAYIHQFPYGPTRHTIMLGMLAASGLAIAIATLPKRTGLRLVWGMLLVAPLWSFAPGGDDIPRASHKKWQVVQCLDYMRANLPPGTLIFSQRQVISMLAYYSGFEQDMPWSVSRDHFSEVLLAGTWRVATRDYIYNTPQEFAAAMAAFRQEYGLTRGEPIWVLDGGWSVVAGPPDAKLPFTTGVRLLQDGNR